VPENRLVGFREEHAVKVTVGWARRLLASIRVDPVGEPSESTLEAFFAGVRWGEDHHPGGLTTLTRPSM
jgi:hypothetical protein